MSSQSKGGGATGSKSYNYFGTIAAGFAAGPLFRLDGIDIDNVRAWTGPLLRSESTNPVSISIPGRGIIRFYWGTEDQLTPDPVLTAGNNGLFHDHPAYTGDCYGVLVDFLFGQERTSAPDVRFVGVRQPVQSLITGEATDLVDDQVNPYVYIAELLTSERFGLGRPLSDFAADAWQAAADAIIPRASKCYVSPWLDRQQNARAVGLDLLSLCDGWIRAEMGTGRAEAGLYPPPEDLVIASLPLINSAALAGPGKPKFDPQTRADVVTRTVVNFTDRTQNFKTRSGKYDDPIAGGYNTQLVTADHFITRPGQADDWANRKGRRDALPKIITSGLNVRATRAAALRAGTHARTDIDAEPGGVQLEQVIRIEAITRSPVGPTRLSIESEPTLAPVLYDPGTEPTPPALIDVPDIEHARLFELPPPLSDGKDFAVGILASRPGQLVTECTVLYDPVDDGDSTFPPLGEPHRNYAFRARLNAAYADDATDAISVELLDEIGREIVADSPGPTAARNDDLLMLVFGPPDTSGGGYRLPLEIFSVVEMTSSGTYLIDVAALRARMGTAPLDHADEAEVWFIRREFLPWYRHHDFPGQAALAADCFFKLQPGTFQASRPLEDCDPRAFKFDTERAYAPVITLTGPELDSGEDYVTCTLGATLSFVGAIADKDGNLTNLSILKSSSAGDVPILTQPIALVSSFSFSYPLLFDVAGVYSIVLTATDSTGRTTTKTVQVRCATSFSGACQPVIRELYSEDRRVWESDPAEGFHGEIVDINIFRSPTMSLIGGPSSTIRIRWARVPYGAPCPSDLDSFEAGTDNTATYVDSVEPDHEWSHEPRRTWAYAEDSTATLTRSPVLFFE